MTKEEYEILWLCFLNECIDEVNITPDNGTSYTDNGGNLIHESQIDYYFKAWQDSLTTSEINEYIKDYPQEHLY